MRKLLPHSTWLLLEFRRLLHPGMAGLYCVYLVFLASTGEDELTSSLLRLDEAGRAALGREHISAGSLLFLVPWLSLHAASTISRWRRAEGGFLGVQPISPASLLVSTAMAWTLALLLLLGASGGTALALHGWGEPTLRYAGGQSLGASLRMEQGETRQFRLDPPQGAQAMVLGVHLARTVGSGREYQNVASEVELALRRANGMEESLLARVHTRARVELALPEGEGELTLTLKHRAGASMALLKERTFEYWRASGPAGLGQIEFFLRAGLGLLVFMGLSAGAGAFMSSPTAALLVLSLWLYASQLVSLRGWLPAARIWRDMEFLRRGRLAEAFEPRWIVTAAGLLLVGGAIACLGLRSWSRE